MSRVATLIILMAFVLPVFAVTCPPGFNWQRMSGVGCVQSDCAAKGGGYTSTDECWCGENVKACYEFVNYTALGFDPKQCGAFCPISKLIGCADKNGRCPNDKPAQNQTQANATPANSSQKECDVNYCKKYQGPHATSIVMNGYCY